MKTNQFPYTYIRGKITKTENAVIPIQAKVIQYGIGCYTGIRANWDAEKKNLYIFRLRDHYDRLKESSKLIGLNFPYTFPKFKKVIIDLIKKNKAKQNLYIRPVIYAGSIEIKPELAPKEDDLAVYIISFDSYLDPAKGIKVNVSSYRRFDDNMIPNKSKATGGYINAALAKAEAKKHKCQETIMLNSRGQVSETSAANIFIIKKGHILTPPLSANNLNGITRRSILELAKNELKTPIKEKNITLRDIKSADELFLTGTASRVVAIGQVDGKKIGTGRQGPITKQIAQAYDEAFTGRSPKYKKWLTPVY